MHFQRFLKSFGRLSAILSQKRVSVAVCGIVALATFVHMAEKLNAQNQAPQWDTVAKLLVFQRDSVKNLRAQVQFSNFYCPAIRAEHEATVKRTSRNKAPIWEMTPNRLYAYSWVVGDGRFRCERRQIFPAKPSSQHPVDFMVFNGEKVFSYDSYLETGTIEASNDADELAFVNDMLGRPQSVIFYQLSWFAMPEADAGQHLNFRYEKDENLDGNICQKFTAVFMGEEGTGRYSCWVAPKLNYALVKLVTASYDLDKQKKTTGRGFLIVLKANNFTEVSPGLWLPRQAKRELYGVQDLKSQWESTQLFDITQMEVNGPVDNHDFDVAFPPATLVGDKITQKNYTVGGSWGEKHSKMLNNLQPETEYRDGDSVPTIDAK